MSEGGARTPWALVALVGVLAIIQAVGLLSSGLVFEGVQGAAYNAVFGWGRMLLFWVAVLWLWKLMRRDGAPSALVAWALALNVFGLAYSQAWTLAAAEGLFLPAWLDGAALGIRISSLVLLAVALLGWPRMDRFVSWALFGYAGVLIISTVLGRLAVPGISQPIVNWGWLGFLSVLAFGLSRLSRNGEPTVT